MNEMLDMLKRWQLEVKQVRDRVYRAPTPRERERWHAVWLLARGWSTEQVAEALGRDMRTIAEWTNRVRATGSGGNELRTERWFPPALTAAQQAELKAAVQAAPQAAGLDLANWNWKVVRQLVQERFGLLLSSRSCLN